MLMALLAALSPSSLRGPLAAIVTIIVVIGSASIYTPGIGTGGWLLATIPLSPFIFAASYLFVWAIQLLGDGLGPTKTSAGILTLTAVMVSPMQIALLRS